ncbi:MAG: HYR domain-containing protein [Flavobacteriales bacterium]|nr:HYR domain-containing protein [Flavobacteriales bacterium]
MTDNCGIATTTNNAPSSFPVGTTTVTWTITDVNGNDVTCSQSVTVNDTQDPTITCPAPVTTIADAGVCYASGVNLGSPVTNDNCGVASVTNNAPTNFNVGTTTVTWIVTDVNGNTASCTQLVTVTDDEDPIITCPSNVAVNNTPGDCSIDVALVSLGNAATSDNCGIASTVNNAPATYNVGTTTVTWTVTDVNGNTATCPQVVTVTDNEDPVVTSCAANVIVNADPSSCAAAGVSLGTPTVTDNCGIATTTNNAPSSFPVGTTTVTWTITDVNGNDVTCSQSVTVNDTQDPTITCPAPVTTTADAGVCYASGVNLGTPVTNDNCGVASVTNNAPATFPVGTTTVTWTVTDAAGNSTTCTQQVTVTDDEDPTISCPGNITVYNDLTNCSIDAANVSLGNASVSDNCGVLTVSNNAPANFNVGTTTVTWTVTDIHGNSTSCTQTVTVIDNEDPVVVSCAPDITQSPDPSVCGSTTVFLGSPSVTDNCGIATVTNNAPAFYPVGTTTVTWTITDIHGNSTTCIQLVTIVDDEVPTISCPSTINVMNDAAVCFASNVSLGTPATSDNCSVASITNNAPATFPVGTTTVTWTVVDQAGNTATCQQNVIVTDNENPSIVCAANATLYNDPGNCSRDSINVTLNAPNVLDNCGIDTVYNNAPAVFNVGTTNVIWTAVDIHGNSSSCVQAVTIIDNEDPMIVNCAAPVSVTADPNVCGAASVSLGSPTVTDNCGIATVTNNAPSFFPVGTTTVTWTITDIHGNSITCTQVVTVTDDEDPTINCPATTIVSSNPGFCYATNVTLGNPTVSDNCGIATITNNAPSIYPVGTTTVMWIVKDIHNNADTCYQTVVVEDNEAPTLTNCPGDTATCNPVYYYQAPTATDNCGIASITRVSGYGPGATFPVGTTTEVWQVTDVHGNITFCSFDVTIHPLPLPSLTPTNVSCNSFGDGEISVNMLNGTAPYDFLWSNGETTQDVANLVPGSYSVLVTDVFGCQGSGSASISEPLELRAEATHHNVSCYGLSDGSIDLTITGGTTPYIYNWSNGATSQDLAAISSGNYSTTITDFHGCTVSLSVNVNQPDTLVVDGTVVDAICEGPNGQIDISVFGGTSPYDYLWSNGDTDQDLDSATMGIYNVLVTDANGCIATYLDTIDSYSIMTLGRDIYHPLCYGDNGAIELTVIDGTAPFTYIWSTGDTTQNLSGIPAGSYSVTVTDANLCAESSTFLVIEPDSLGISFEVSEYEGGFGVSGYAEEDGYIDMTVVGGTTPYEITWVPFSTDEDLYDLSAGDYHVTVTDFNGCTVYGEVSLTQPMDLAIPTGFTPNNDSYNDFFVIQGVEAFPDNELLIYNRWGNLVYNKVGYLNEWDGLNNNGEQLPDGTYFVIFEIKSGNLDNINIDIPYSGYVDLRRTR